MRMMFWALFLLVAAMLSMALMVKFYGNVDEVYWNNIINHTNYAYINNLKYIDVFEQSNGPVGGTYWPGTIFIYNGNQDGRWETYTHELAHNCQWMRNDTWYNLVFHIGKWHECLDWTRGGISND